VATEHAQVVTEHAQVITKHTHVAIFRMTVFRVACLKSEWFVALVQSMTSLAAVGTRVRYAEVNGRASSVIVRASCLFRGGWWLYTRELASWLDLWSSPFPLVSERHLRSLRTRAFLVSVRGLTMQEASASCAAGDDSDPPDPHLSFPLRRPSFSIELYNRFSQDALNASLPDNPSVNNNISDDMDFETDADADIDVLAGAPPTRGSDGCSVGHNITRNSTTQEGNAKTERKRANGDCDSVKEGSAKKISTRKISSEVASSYDAISAAITPNASPSTYSIVSSIKYNNNDRPPFIIQVQPVDDADVTSFHPLHISRILSQISPRDIVEIRKTGRSRVIAEMRNREAANRLIANDQLLLQKLKAFIPAHRVLRTGIVRDVPQDFSLERLREATTSTIKILEIHRLNRRTKVEGEIKYLPSRTLCVKFAGQFLPHHVSICNCIFPVLPFIPKARICFACFRVGHMSKNYKSQPRCIYCGDGRHREEEECSLKNSPPICINCKGSHLPTSHECVLVVRHKMALSLASTENIPFAEAKKKVNISSPDFPHKDLRFDYQNFPNLPRHHQSPPPS